MRFSCQFSDNTREVICHILTGVSKVAEASVCALVLSEEEGLEIRAVTSSMSAFGKIEPAQFSSFTVQSKNQNLIAIEVQIGSLLSAFKTSSSSHGTSSSSSSSSSACDQLTFRLIKNKANVVCFCLSTRGVLTNIQLIQEVPVVKLLWAADQAHYREPAVGDAQVTIAFPEAKLAKTVLDRMKNLGKVVHIKADQRTGKLVFRMDTDVVSTRTVFDGLALANAAADDVSLYGNSGNHQQQQQQVSQRHAHRHQYVVAQLNCKEFGAITSALASFSKRTNNTVLAIVQHCVVCVHVSFDDESHLTFYLATVPRSVEEEELEQEEQEEQEEEGEEEGGGGGGGYGGVEEDGDHRHRAPHLRMETQQQA